MSDAERALAIAALSPAERTEAFGIMSPGNRVGALQAMPWDLRVAMNKADKAALQGLNAYLDKSKQHSRSDAAYAQQLSKYDTGPAKHSAGLAPTGSERARVAANASPGRRAALEREASPRRQREALPGKFTPAGEIVYWKDL